MIEEGDEEEEEYEYEEDEEEASSLEDEEVVSKDDDDYEDESISELITRTVDVSGFIGDNTELVFFGAIILAVILAFGKTQNHFFPPTSTLDAFLRGKLKIPNAQEYHLDRNSVRCFN